MQVTYCLESLSCLSFAAASMEKLNSKWECPPHQPVSWQGPQHLGRIFQNILVHVKTSQVGHIRQQSFEKSEQFARVTTEIDHAGCTSFDQQFHHKHMTLLVKGRTEEALYLDLLLVHFDLVFLHFDLLLLHNFDSLLFRISKQDCFINKVFKWNLSQSCHQVLS